MIVLHQYKKCEQINERERQTNRQKSSAGKENNTQKINRQKKIACDLTQQTLFNTERRDI